ncbi:hypothetical protein LTR22_027867 [Elasticomyces elasticus]|nr:hypothetical protein LTR22_027867 [Elasticomyces elasticus]
MADPTAGVVEALCPSYGGTWILGDRLRLSLHANRVMGYHCTWEDGRGSWYLLSDLASSIPDTGLPQELRALKPIYVAGEYGVGGHAVWDLGTAFLKIINPTSPHSTREHVTLQYVKQKKPSFIIPEVLYHGEWDGRYHLVVTRVPGPTLIKAWPEMTIEMKLDCIDRIVEICQELASWRGDEIAGVDGGQICDRYLCNDDDEPNFSHECLLKSCQGLGMDCSTLVFFHCDLGPSNILYANGGVSVIDWEVAGFVPKEWIRTKFRLSSGMDLDCEGELKYEYRTRVQARLGESGFCDVADRWVARCAGK